MENYIVIDGRETKRYNGDTEAGDLIYTPTYFYIGHFSKFFCPEVKRISTLRSRIHLLCTSFVNEDNSTVDMIMNQSDEAIDYKFYVGDVEAISISIPAHAIQTVVTK